MLTLAAVGGGDAQSQIIQVVGALLVLSGFAGAQFGYLSPQSVPYLVVNLIGSAILTFLAARDAQYGFLLLEAVWALVSLWGLIGVLRGRPSAGVRH